MSFLLLILIFNHSFLNRASFEICLRSFSCDIGNLGFDYSKDSACLIFNVDIQGTPPKVEDLYVILFFSFKQTNIFAVYCNRTL